MVLILFISQTRSRAAYQYIKKKERLRETRFLGEKPEQETNHISTFTNYSPSNKEIPYLSKTRTKQTITGIRARR